MCRQACPVGHVTHRETLTPHGWALMIESVARRQLSWTRDVVEVMYACADCGLCQAHCVTDQPLPDAINAARIEIARAGAALPIVYEVEGKLRERAAGLPPIARGVAAGRPALFVGDVAADVGGAAVTAALALLEASGIDAVPIGVGRPSGVLANTLGLEACAKELAAGVVAEIEASGASQVIVLTPGDRWVFEHVYPKRLGIAWPTGMALREVVDVLAVALDAGRLRFSAGTDTPYAYHDPCHTARLGAPRPAPRALLAAALGAAGARDLFWREGRAHPCGAIGGLDVTHPGITTLLSDARITDAARAGARWLVTDDPGCLYQLASRPASGVEVRGLFELLHERLA
jgi:Fe-S oxidoreductase